jgi:hypothetical protein
MWLEVLKTMKPIILMFCNKKVNSVPYVEYRFSEGQSHLIFRLLFGQDSEDVKKSGLHCDHNTVLRTELRRH